MADTIEKRLGELEKLVFDMPDILNIRFSRVDRDIADVKRTAAETNESLATMGQRLTRIERAIEAMPRAIAEMLAERDKT